MFNPVSLNIEWLSAPVTSFDGTRLVHFLGRIQLIPDNVLVSISIRVQFRYEAVETNQK